MPCKEAIGTRSKPGTCTVLIPRRVAKFIAFVLEASTFELGEKSKRGLHCKTLKNAVDNGLHFSQSKSNLICLATRVPTKFWPQLG